MTLFCMIVSGHQCLPCMGLFLGIWGVCALLSGQFCKQVPMQDVAPICHDLPCACCVHFRPCECVRTPAFLELHALHRGCSLISSCDPCACPPAVVVFPRCDLEPQVLIVQKVHSHTRVFVYVCMEISTHVNPYSSHIQGA